VGCVSAQRQKSHGEFLICIMQRRGGSREMMAVGDGPEGGVRASHGGAGMLHATHPHGHHYLDSLFFFKKFFLRKDNIFLKLLFSLTIIIFE
jgi:hypothetical protein